ncbi:hypothetical protein KW5_0114785, partial [Xanthomonas vasicola pv. vasculorum NCPPB 1326]
MCSHTILAAFIPFGGFFLIALQAQLIGFGGGVITHDLTGLLPKRRGDLRTRTDLLLQFLPVPAFHQTIGAVASEHVAVERSQHVADALAG